MKPIELDAQKEQTPIEKEVLEGELEIFKKSLNMLKYAYLCSECLGRQFSYLSTNTTNSQRGRAILLGLTMECHRLIKKSTVQKQYKIFDMLPLNVLFLIEDRTDFLPTKSLIEKIISKESKIDFKQYKYNKRNKSINKEFKCTLCQNILFPDSIELLSEYVFKGIEDYDFDTFLLGTRLSPILEDREEEFRVRHEVKNGESFKKNLNRLLGKRISSILRKEVDYKEPELTIIIDLPEANLDKFKLELIPKSFYFKARYLKFSRELPQTRWHCKSCWGSGKDKSGNICRNCKGTGKKYQYSIEEMIEEVVLKYTKGEKGVLHGAGREDVDARCIGNGRPIVFEVKNPLKRYINLQSVQKEINDIFGDSIHIKEIQACEKEAIMELKDRSTHDRKKYLALVYLEQKISEEEFTKKREKINELLNDKYIEQKTPNRVVHRRADKVRRRKIFKIEGKYIDPVHIFFRIEAEAGTYIKELISSDKLRTEPSIAEIVGIPMKCVELDVVYIL